MGLTKRGRSRTWIDDHGWWLGEVTFDSSSYSKGSYLMVGAMWLWDDDHPYFHFATGGRIGGFVEFESEEQFAPEARRLAELAAREVKRNRELFPNVRTVAEFLEAREDGGNPHTDALLAGVAWGLLGEMDAARETFARSHQIIEDYWRGGVAEVASRSDAERARAREEGVHFYTRANLASERDGLNEEHGRVARYEA